MKLYFVCLMMFLVGVNALGMMEYDNLEVAQAVNAYCRSSGTAPPQVCEAAASRDFLWDGPFPRILKVKFMNGTPDKMNQVKKSARIWSEYAGIYFDFLDPCSSEYADIRVSFNDNRRCWSHVGQAATTVSPNKPTISFGWLDEPTILHEFGHALGLIHEHQSPASAVAWNKEAVYQYYRELGWTDDMIDTNFFRSQRNVTNSEFDPKSIMLYEIPKGFAKNFTAPRNTELSELDKKFIGKLYPNRPFLVSTTHHNDRKVSHEFSELGPMHQVGHLIWSEVAAQAMSHADALTFCQALGRGSRLPTHEEWEALAKAMGKGVAHRKYDPDLMAGTRGEFFWSSSAYNADSFFIFHGDDGSISHNEANNSFSVRCVALGWEPAQVKEPPKEPLKDPENPTGTGVSESAELTLESYCGQSHCSQYNQSCVEQTREVPGSFVFEANELHRDPCTECGNQKQLRLGFTQCQYQIKRLKNKVFVEGVKESAFDTTYVPVEQDWEKLRVTVEALP